MDLLHPTHDPSLAVSDMAAGILATLRMARGLVAGNRAIDLAGLDTMVGILCARALDLPPAHGQKFWPELLQLVAAVDELTAALTQATTADD